MVKTFEVTLVLKLTIAGPVRVLGRGAIFLRRLFHLRTVSISTTFVSLCRLCCGHIIALDHVGGECFSKLSWGRQWWAAAAGSQGTYSMSLST